MTALSGLLREEIEAGSFPGGVALVGSGEEILETAFAGHAVQEPETVEVSLETVFDLASLTKPLCAGALTALAVDSGLDLALPPGRFLPGWKKTRYQGITLEMLLSHTSGMPAWYPVYVRGEGAEAYRKTLGELEPEKKPGSAVIYSDLNFLLLGEILETHYASPLDCVFEGLVARPAGSEARFLLERSRKVAATEKGDRTEREMTAALGLSYAHFRTGVVWGEVHDGNAFRRGGVAGNAGLFGTAGDVWALARQWLLLPRSDFSTDRTPGLSEGRGLAWQGHRGAGSAVPGMSGRSFGHTGFTGTSVWIDPDRQRVYVLLTNRIHPEAKETDFNQVRRRFHEAALHAS